MVSGGIFPETLFLAVLLKLSVPDSRKCLGKPRVNMKWNLNLEKMPPLLKQRITRKFLEKWHFACGGIFRETLFYRTGEGRVKISIKTNTGATGTYKKLSLQY